MEFRTSYVRKPSTGEKGGGKCLVEKTGYIPPKRQIENMLAAGKRLAEYRHMTYDFPDGKIDESYNDPTRALNYDLADATQQLLQAEENLKIAQEEVEAAKLASQSVQEAPGEVLE